MADTNTTYDRTYEANEIEDDEFVNNDIRTSGAGTGDAEKGATLGGVGGAVVGAVAGAAAGPIGAVAGAIIGGLAGGVASGAAVGAIDRHDNDNSITGLRDTSATGYNDRAYNDKYATPINDTSFVANDTVRYPATTVPNEIRSDYDNVAREVRTESDSVRYGAANAANSGVGTGVSRETELGERTPSLKTGGVANDGTPDTRGIGEKFVDGITGDVVDDKTGSVVDHR